MRADTATREIDYSRAAYDVFLCLDAAARARVGEAAARAPSGREIAPDMFSVDAGPGLRVVLRHEAAATTVLALTGDMAVARSLRGRRAS